MTKWWLNPEAKARRSEKLKETYRRKAEKASNTTEPMASTMKGARVSEEIKQKALGLVAGGMSQIEAAKTTGVDSSTVSRWITKSHVSVVSANVRDPLSIELAKLPMLADGLIQLAGVLKTLPSLVTTPRSSVRTESTLAGEDLNETVPWKQLIEVSRIAKEAAPQDAMERLKKIRQIIQSVYLEG